MGRVVYKLYYPFDMDDYDKEFPQSTLPFNTDTYFEEIDCTRGKVMLLQSYLAYLSDQVLDELYQI